MTEKNFVDGNLNTNYLQHTYTEGFKGRQLAKKDIHSLISIACAVFMRESARSRSFANQEPNAQLYQSFTQDSYNLYVDLRDNPNLENQEVFSVTASRVGDKCKISIDDFDVELPMDMSLSAMTFDFDINGEIKTTQLMAMNGDGTYRIQYEGTIVSMILDYLESQP